MSHLTFFMDFWMMERNFLASEGSCFSAYLLVRMGKRARNFSWWTIASSRRDANLLMLRRWLLQSRLANPPYLWLIMPSRMIVYSSISRRSWSFSPNIMISGYSYRYSPSSLMLLNHASYSRSIRSISCSLCDLKFIYRTKSRSRYNLPSKTSPNVTYRALTPIATLPPLPLPIRAVISSKSDGRRMGFRRSSAK